MLANTSEKVRAPPLCEVVKDDSYILLHLCGEYETFFSTAGFQGDAPVRGGEKDTKGASLNVFFQDCEVIFGNVT